MKLAEKKEKKERRRYGDFQALHHPGGGFTIWGPGIRESGQYVPSDETLRKKFSREELWRDQCSTIKTGVFLRGVLATPNHRPSNIAGREAIGLNYQPQNRPVSYEEIEGAVKDFWPPEKVDKFMRGKRVKLEPINKFRDSHPKEYASAARAKAHGGFKRVLNRIYPGLYSKLKGTLDPESLDPANLGAEIRRRFYLGEPVSSASLRNSQDPEDNKLHAAVLMLKRRGYITRADGYTEIAARISGLKPRDIEMSYSASRDLGFLTEALTELVCTWGPHLGVRLEGLVEGGKINRAGGETAYVFNGKRTPKDARKGVHADLRVGDRAIEVKAGVSWLTPAGTQEIVDRYTPSEAHWKDGKPIDSSTVVFFMKPENYRRRLKAIKDAGIDVISHERFTEALEEVVDGIQERRPGLVANLRPRVHDLNYIKRLNEQTVHSQASLLRSGNVRKVEWAKDLIYSLIDEARNESTSDKQEELHRVTGGRVIRPRTSPFLYVEKQASELGAGKIGEYIEENGDKLKLSEVRRHFPELTGSSKIAIFDSEIRGLRYSDPIIMISMADLDSDRVRAFVARDYGEEEAAINAFVEAIKGYDGFVTYNGLSFDIPRIGNRARHLGLRVNGPDTTELSAVIGGRHVDLYPALKRQLGRRIPDHRLSTVEKIIFKTSRVGDISGSLVPEIYESYVQGKSGPQKMARVVRHGMLDVVTPKALLAYAQTLPETRKYAN